jgi:hypothetical protein
MPGGDNTGGAKVGTSQDKQSLLLVLLKEQCDAMRARSEAEHLYTAAAVGSFGAVAWGVAALPSRYSGRVLMLPAIVAAIGIMAVAVLISIKIVGEHREYETAKRVRVTIAQGLDGLADNAGTIPDYMLKPKEGLGYRGSVWIVVGAALMAAGFCVSIAWC